MVDVEYGTGVRVNITNCTIQETAGWGVWIANAATVNEGIEDIDTNTFADNAEEENVFREPT